MIGTTYSVFEAIGGLEFDEICSVEYESRISPQKAPRKLHVIIPSMINPTERYRGSPSEVNILVVTFHVETNVFGRALETRKS